MFFTDTNALVMQENSGYELCMRILVKMNYSYVYDYDSL